MLSPAFASLAAGDSETYTVERFDASDDDLGPVTEAVLSISPDGGTVSADAGVEEAQRLVQLPQKPYATTTGARSGLRASESSLLCERGRWVAPRS
jgi:hypothetical protein